jgi:hypothetical protein
MLLFITAVPITTLCARGGRGIVEDRCCKIRRAEACERGGKEYCEKGGWQEDGDRVKERVRRSVHQIPNPDPNPKQAPQMSLKEA